MTEKKAGKCDVDLIIHELERMTAAVSLLTDQLQEEMNETSKLCTRSDRGLIDRLTYLHDAAAFLISDTEQKVATLRISFNSYTAEA